MSCELQAVQDFNLRVQRLRDEERQADARQRPSISSGSSIFVSGTSDRRRV
jgi:hypothetical protein